MEKSAVKTYKDPALNKLVQEKANWNRQVSALINDLIHFKKSMNGWPSKFYKERSRITQPVPVDLAGVLGKMSSEFQEIANSGNSIIQEQTEFAKTRVKRKSDQTLNTLEKLQGPETGTPAAKPAPNLSQEMGKQLAAATDSQNEMLKVASIFEDKYFLESEASNPFSRFVTRLFNPRFGFGEGARIRRLRMAMLDNCVKSYKELKILHKEIVKSSKVSIVNSHNMMTQIWNYWNAVNRLFSTYKSVKPGAVTDEGGQIDDPDLKKEKLLEQGRDPEEGVAKTEIQEPVITPTSNVVVQIKDFRDASNYLGSIVKNKSFEELHSLIEFILAAPKNKKVDYLKKSNLEEIYNKAIMATNQELGTAGNTFQEISQQYKSKTSAVTKEAQKWLGKTRHQILPGATSGQRLEIYRLISQVRKDLDQVMNLLEKGFDQEQLTTNISQVNREMVTLRTMIRSLYFVEKPIPKGSKVQESSWTENIF